jgi:hypothetical protein
MVDKVIGKLELEAGRNYMDYIIIGSETFEHLEDLERIFIQLKKTELRI